MSNLIKREKYIQKFFKLKDKEEIKIITGVRRCGKTCFLKLIEKELLNSNIKRENIIFISFESAKYDFINNYRDLNDYIFKITENLNGKIYLLFDEIQFVENWEKSINAFRIDIDSDIYITGSNSKLLSGEFATLLSGRYISINMFPFSFKEYVDYFGETLNIEVLFQEYLKYGGFPGLLKYGEFEKQDYIRDIHDTIVLNDILARNKIYDVNLLKKLIEYIINTIGQIFSSVSISKYLKNQGIKTSPKTILNYMDFISNSFLIYGVKKEDFKGKSIFKNNNKYYVVDPAFYCLLNDESEWSMRSLLENIVFLELLRRGYNVTIGKVGDLEVDFICKKFGKKVYIQVSETILGEETRERELKSLKKINDNYPKYILTLDTFKFPSEGILHENIVDFLLGDFV